MIKWDEIKKDLQKGWKEGVVAIKEGMVVVQKKAGALSDEGKKQYKVLSLKTSIQKSIHDLGRRVYTLMASPRTAKTVGGDAKVKSIVVQIRGYERQISGLEKETRPARTAAKRPKKKTSRATR